MRRDVAFSLIEREQRLSRDMTVTDWEVQVTSRLGDHPHIVTIYDVGQDQGTPYLVSQLMRGGTLAEVCEKCSEEGGRLALNDALRHSKEVCIGLAYVHEHGLLHRDLQPRNIWLDGGGTAHLGDFDLALPLDRPQEAGLPVTTLAYRPPEQIRGRYLDVRSDLYSLGATFFELLTGRPPFEGNEDEVLRAHLEQQPEPPSTFRPEIPGEFDELILVLLAKDPAQRMDDAEAVAEVLDRISSEQTTIAEPGNIAALIAEGESDRLEFKASLRHPHGMPEDAPPDQRKGMTKTIETTVAKVIASFLNAGGGTLLIGVADDGSVLGIEHDFTTLSSKPTLDGWELAFKEAMANRLGSSARTCTSLRFVRTEEGTVAAVTCGARKKPTWLYPDTDKEEFWVRVGNANERLSPSRAHAYIEEHWNS